MGYDFRRAQAMYRNPFIPKCLSQVLEYGYCETFEYWCFFNLRISTIIGGPRKACAGLTTRQDPENPDNRGYEKLEKHGSSKVLQCPILHACNLSESNSKKWCEYLRLCAME